ncbi:MAG: TolC family protein [Crocinitomicaceae bacterium]|nr:TolC family protein [Crocinitomicaceae bacterium]
MNKAVLFLFLFLSTWASAQVYSLADLLKMADTANLTLKNARLDVNSNINQRKAFLASQYPKITANGDYRYNAIIPGQIVPADFFGGPPGTFAEVQFGVPINLSNTVQLTQFIFNPQLNYGLNALAINAQIVAVQEKMAFQEVHYQVSNTFFGLQAINQQLAYLQKNEKNMNELIRNMELMQQQGLIIPTEVDKLKINRNSITNGIIKLENTRLQLNQLLSILVGFPEGTTLTIASDEIISNPTIIEQTNALRPELELIQLQKQMNIEERKGTYMAYLPTLSFYGAYNYNYNMKPEDDFRTGIPSAFLGLRLDWTLFDGFEKKNKLKVNAYNKEKIQNQELLATQQLNLATANAKREAELQTANLEMNKEQLRLSERVYDAAKAQFKAGTISTNELLQADNGLQQAQSSLVGAYLSLRQAELSYLKSISQLK